MTKGLWSLCFLSTLEDFSLLFYHPWPNCLQQTWARLYFWQVWEWVKGCDSIALSNGTASEIMYARFNHVASGFCIYIPLAGLQLFWLWTWRDSYKDGCWLLLEKEKYHSFLFSKHLLFTVTHCCLTNHPKPQQLETKGKAYYLLHTIFGVGTFMGF